MTLRSCLLLLTAGCAACFSDPPAPQRISGESGSSTGDTPGTDGSGGEDSSSSGEHPTTTTFGSSSSGEPGFGCQDAFDAQSCSAANDPAFEQCSWYPTHTHDPRSCEPWATDGGACVIEQSLEDCPGSGPTCPNGASWYYQVSDGLVEILDATNLCYGLSEFTPCPWPGEDPDETVGTSVGSSTSVGSTASTAEGSGTSGGGDTGASASSVGDGGTSGGTGGDGWTLQDEIESVCACACDK